MRLEIIIHEQPTTKRKLAEHPPKDGVDTEYACGLWLIGSWASRLEQHTNFCKTSIGRYILKLERTF